MATTVPQRTQGQGSLLQAVFQSLILAYLPTHSCTQLSIHSFLQPASHSATHPFIHSHPAYVPTYPHTHPPFYPHPLIQLLILQSTHPFTRSFISPSIYPSVLLSLHPPTNPFT